MVTILKKEEEMADEHTAGKRVFLNLQRRNVVPLGIGRRG